MLVRIRDLTMQYGRAPAPALDGFSLEIGQGTFGLLGPNGAGKTTLMRILATQLVPTSGTVTVDEWDLQRHRPEVRRLLGYLPQHFGGYPSLTAAEFLDYMGRLGRLPGPTRRDRVAAVLHDVGLYEVRHRRVGAFSGGMVRRLGIAQALLCEPGFLIVDEPTVGLDPEERIRFRGILSRLARDRAVLISTHIVGDLASTCDDLAVLLAGRLLFHGPPEELVRRAAGKTWRARVDDAGFEALSQRGRVVNVAVDGDRLLVRLVGDEPPPGAEPVPPSLEDAYVHFVGAPDESEEG
ncbi:MAG: ABC transporter ATP-binding protein [Gemmatimonadota bacterium]